MQGRQQDFAAPYKGKARTPALLLGDVLEEEGSRLRRCTHHLAGGLDKEARNRAAPAACGPRRLGSGHLPLWARLNCIQTLCVWS